jgi:flagellar biosynthesis/type III secretory pathway M-ring protein FliF/YscJ
MATFTGNAQHKDAPHGANKPTPMKPQSIDQFLFVTFPLALICIIMFWTLVRAIMRRRARNMAADAELRRETRAHVN